MATEIDKVMMEVFVTQREDLNKANKRIEEGARHERYLEKRLEENREDCRKLEKELKEYKAKVNKYVKFIKDHIEDAPDDNGDN